MKLIEEGILHKLLRSSLETNNYYLANICSYRIWEIELKRIGSFINK